MSPFRSWCSLSEYDMPNQRFHADPAHTFTWPNGAVGYRSGESFDCLGPYAKVVNCPIEGLEGVRLTCYARGYADTYFSVPACTKYNGQYISGYFTGCHGGGEGCVFRVLDKHRERCGLVRQDVTRLTCMGIAT